MHHPDVVIVSYNTLGHLRECLASIPADEAGDVVVVDNGSTDGSAEMVRAEFPWVRLIVDPRNRGYGAASNLGIRSCGGDAVVLLNSDTILPRGALRAMNDYLHAHPRVGLLGPRLLNGDGTLQRSCFPFPSPLTAFLGETHLGFLIRFIPLLRSRYPRTWAHDAARPMPWVLGAVMAIRRSAFETIGGFDESYFMYAEEIDLCYRLWETGWEVHFAPVTDVVHQGGASTSNYRSEMLVQFYASMAHFYRLHRGPLALRTMSAIVRTRSTFRLLGAASRCKLARGDEIRERLAGEVRANREIVRGGWVRPRHD